MCLAMWMRALAVGLSMAAALVLAGPAAAASTLYISGGGDGHGVGMSQYGAYGYALNGWNYQQILAHYYTGTALAQTSPSQTVRVLLGSGSAAFAGATQAAGKQLDPSLTYDVVPLKSGQLSLVNQSTHKLLGKFSAPLTATGPGPAERRGPRCVPRRPRVSPQRHEGRVHGRRGRPRRLRPGRDLGRDALDLVG